MTIFSKNFGGIAPLAPSWLRLWITAQNARAVSVVLWCSSYHTFECERLGEEVNILECRGATSTSISGGQFSWNFIRWRNRAYSTVVQLFRKRSQVKFSWQHFWKWELFSFIKMQTKWWGQS